MKYWTRTITAVVSVAVGMSMTGKGATNIFTQPVVDIFENNGKPAESTNAPYKNLTDLTWMFLVKNNSDTQPTNNPWKEGITNVKLYNIYSSRKPLVTGLPSYWSMSSVVTNPATGDNLWTFSFQCDNGYDFIGPGADDYFSIRTYKPAGYQLTMGTLLGQGRFETWAWKPVESNDFIGPIGASSDVFTKTILEISEDDGIPEGSGTNYLWRFILKNNSDTEPTNQPYMTNVTQVVMSNIYSSVQPTFTSLPSGWTGSNVFLSPLPYGLNNSNMWMLILTATNSGIPPGSVVTSAMTTYVPSGYQAPVTGTIEGAEGYLPNPNFGWMPASGFVGPVAKPIPESAVVVALMAVMGWRRRTS